MKRPPQSLLKPFNVKAAAHAWKKTEPEARVLLDKLASRGMMLDTEIAGERREQLVDRIQRAVVLLEVLAERLRFRRLARHETDPGRARGRG